MPAAHTEDDHGLTLLSAHLRLPDLTYARHLTEQDAAVWLDRAREALAWGPEDRNGCHRITMANGTLAWVDEDEQYRSPDPWTPACNDFDAFEWHHNGYLSGAPGQPSTLVSYQGWAQLVWRDRDGRHRAHGPADLRSNGEHYWWWRGGRPQADQAALLDVAWSDPGLTDADAHTLLDAAAALQPDLDLTVTAQAWVAHVLAANPHAALTPATRGWLALLTA